MKVTAGPPPSGQQYELRDGDQHAVVVEVGGGLRLYEAGGGALLDGYELHEMCDGARGAILSPWPNRIEDGAYQFDWRSFQLPLTEPSRRTAIHGLARWQSWRPVETEPRRIVLECVLNPQPGYPWRLLLSVAYELRPDGLAVTTAAVNQSAEACPFGTGAHPYVTAGGRIDDCLLELPAGAHLPASERGIPTGEPMAVAGTEFDFTSPRLLGSTVLDTAYTGLRRNSDGHAVVTLTDPSRSSVEVWMDGRFPYLMIFSGDTLAPGRRRRGLGVEPMTCAPNAFRSGDGLLLLQPGESFSASWGIRPGRQQA